MLDRSEDILLQSSRVKVYHQQQIISNSIKDNSLMLSLLRTTNLLWCLHSKLIWLWMLKDLEITFRNTYLSNFISNLLILLGGNGLENLGRFNKVGSPITDARALLANQQFCGHPHPSSMLILYLYCPTLIQEKWAKIIRLTKFLPT